MFDMRVGKGLLEPAQAVGDLRVPFKDVPQPFVSEPDNVALVIDKAPQGWFHISQLCR